LIANQKSSDNHQPEKTLFEEKVREWWNSLKEKHRGERAELRRCRSLTAAIFTPGYHRLRRKLAGTKWNNDKKLVTVAMVLAHVKEDTGLKFVDSMAQPKEIGSDTPKVSGLRFRRLLKCNSHEELCIHLIRIVHLLKNVHITDLAKDVYWWNDNKIRQDWAFKYYEKAPSAD